MIVYLLAVHGLSINHFPKRVYRYSSSTNSRGNLILKIENLFFQYSKSDQPILKKYKSKNSPQVK